MPTKRSGEAGNGDGDLKTIPTPANPDEDTISTI
jgi:hypothetical protein